MRIRSIFFDLDDTLTVHERLYDESYRELLGPFTRDLSGGIDKAIATTKQLATLMGRMSPSRQYLEAIGIGGRDILWGDSDGKHPELKALANRIPKFRTDFWQQVLSKHGVSISDTKAKQMATMFPREMRSRIFAFDDALAVLKFLKNRFNIGLVTNGLPRIQREKLNLVGIRQYFDTIAVSGEIGSGKPRPEIFFHALEKSHCKPSQTIMVGDVPARDIAGAQAVGIGSIWINRVRRPLRKWEPRPDAEISTLRELYEVIEKKFA